MALTAALVRVGQGDQSAFGFVYTATHAKLLGVCLKLLADRQAAEDVLQNVYVVIWLKAHTFDGRRGSPISWMTAIVRNRAINALRSARRCGPSEPLDDRRQFVDPTALASEVIERNEQAARLRRSLARLPHRHRNAVHAAFYEDLTYREVADRENVPCGTMKSWIRRGIIDLKTRMIEPAPSISVAGECSGTGVTTHRRATSTSPRDRATRCSPSTIEQAGGLSLSLSTPIT